MPDRIVPAALLVAIGVAVSQAHATEVSDSDSYGYAEVVQGEPIIEIVREPVHREVCREVRSRHQRRSSTPTILGGLIGGVIGNQFGSGSGRTAATVAGAAAGAYAGNEHSRRHSESTDERHCELVTEYREYERVSGYRVTYRYDGEVRVAETKERPGDYLKLALSPA